jgi:predicted nuclease of predicted toxin-antitoxin system
MAVAVKLDEDLSPLVAEPLVGAGYDVATVWSQGWSGLKDSELWLRVVEESRFFITADKGFGDLRAFPPGQHPGIVVLRPDRESIVDYRDLVARLLALHALDDLAGCVVVVNARGIRIRKPAR